MAVAPGASNDAVDEPVQRHSVHTLVFRSLKRSADMFLSDYYNLPPVDEKWLLLFARARQLVV